jgi:hypothetical protein
MSILRCIKQRKPQANENYEVNESSSARTSNSSRDILAEPEMLLKNQNSFKIEVLDVIECGHFWARIVDSHYDDEFKYIFDTLNSPSYRIKLLPKESLYEGKLCATIYWNKSLDVEIFRAKIKKIYDTHVEVSKREGNRK